MTAKDDGTPCLAEHNRVGEPPLVASTLAWILPLALNLLPCWTRGGVIISPILGQFVMQSCQSTVGCAPHTRCAPTASQVG